MSEGEVKTGVPTDVTMAPSRKAAVVMAAAGVIGFGAGWGLSVMFTPEAPPLFLPMVGLVVGATGSWLIGRLGNKPAI